VLSQLGEDLAESQAMAQLSQMGLMMVDWMDPQKTVYVPVLHIWCLHISQAGHYLPCRHSQTLRGVLPNPWIRIDTDRCSEREGIKQDQTVHLDLAIEILKSILVGTSSTFTAAVQRHAVLM
jgi:hypothetical protein